MKIQKRFLMKNNIEGFSLIETLVALAIASLIGVAIISCFSIGLKSMTKVSGALKDSFLYLKTDSKIRQFATNVKRPYWIKDCTVEISEHDIQLQWLNGKNSIESINFSKDVDFTNLEVVKSKESYPLGIIVTYKIKEKEYKTKTTFGSFPQGYYQLCE